MYSRQIFMWVMAVSILSGMGLFAQGDSKNAPDTSSDKVVFVVMVVGLKLRILNWRSTGCSLILLAELEFDVHAGNQFKLSLAPEFHVDGILCRVSGVADSPEPNAMNDSASQREDNSHSAVDALRIARPALMTAHALPNWPRIQQPASYGSRRKPPRLSFG